MDVKTTVIDIPEQALEKGCVLAFSISIGGQFYAAHQIEINITAPRGIFDDLNEIATTEQLRERFLSPNSDC